MSRTASKSVSKLFNDSASRSQLPNRRQTQTKHAELYPKNALNRNNLTLDLDGNNSSGQARPVQFNLGTTSAAIGQASPLTPHFYYAAPDASAPNSPHNTSYSSPFDAPAQTSGSSTSQTIPLPSPAPSATSVSHRTERKQNSACDACRARKVKCIKVPGESTCQHCINKSIECTRYYVTSVSAIGKRGRKGRASLSASTRSTRSASSSTTQLDHSSEIMEGSVVEHCSDANTEQWDALPHRVVKVIYAPVAVILDETSNAPVALDLVRPYSTGLNADPSVLARAVSPQIPEYADYLQTPNHHGLLHSYGNMLSPTGSMVSPAGSILSPTGNYLPPHESYAPFTAALNGDCGEIRITHSSPTLHHSVAQCSVTGY